MADTYGLLAVLKPDVEEQYLKRLQELIFNHVEVLHVERVTVDRSKLDGAAPDSEKILGCIGEALRQEWDDSSGCRVKATGDATALAIHRVAVTLLGKLQRAGIQVDEAKFMKDSCDGELGDY